MHRCRALPCLSWLLVLLLAVPAAAQEGEEARDRLESLQEQLETDRDRTQRLAEEAEALRGEIERLRAEGRKAAAAVQELEDGLSDQELLVALHRLQALRSGKRLQDEEERLTRSLAALQRLGLLPPESALTAPGEPLDALRAALLLGEAVPQLASRARRYAELHARHTQARERAAAERDRLAEQAAALKEERLGLQQLVERRQGILGGTAAAREEARERMAALTREADDLRQLIEQLEAEAAREQARREEQAQKAAEAATRARELREAAEREAERARQDRARAAEAEATAQAAAEAEAEAAQQQEQAHATPRSVEPEGLRSFPNKQAEILQLPARGRIVLGYGEENARREQPRSQGLVIETRPSAQVVAPFDGKVVYAGRFRRYGQILIIEHDGRYHSLVAGLGRLAVATGQWVLAGEPVGSMAGSEEGAPELYFELRHTGQPIDPLPWLAMSGNKARG